MEVWAGPVAKSVTSVARSDTLLANAPRMEVNWVWQCRVRRRIRRRRVIAAAAASDRQPAALAADMGICQETVPKARECYNCKLVIQYSIQKVANHTTTQVEKLVISAETAHQRLQMSVSATNASSLATSKAACPN